MFKSANGATFDLAVWLKDNNVAARGPEPYDGGERWKLRECPFNPEHTGTSVAVGRKPSGQVWFKCQHDGCAGKTWQDARERLQPGWRRWTPNLTSKRKEVSFEAISWPEPEDRGEAVLSELGDLEYVDDTVRPGRIMLVAAEEGTGKSYAIDDELAIRVARAGGSFAGTWPVLQTGPVLVLSEMHSDDDYKREETTLASLGLTRDALRGRYYRLPLMTAANGTPVLMEPAWREWIVEWCKQRGVILQVYDTASAATQGDPWGEQIRDVFRSLRVMLEAYPQLAMILIVHLKKPSGHGGRRISDVVGEWGRWCDVIMMLERDGPRTKISTLKRVRTERRIVATRAGGLLVDAADITEGSQPKVPVDKVVRTIEAAPGMTIAELAEKLNVGKATASRYVQTALDLGHVRVETDAKRRTQRLFFYPSGPATASPHHADSQTGDAVPDALVRQDRITAPPPIYGGAVGDAVHPPPDSDDYYAPWAEEQRDAA